MKKMFFISIQALFFMLLASCSWFNKTPEISSDLSHQQAWLKSRHSKYQKSAGELIPQCLSNLKLGNWAIGVEYHAVHVTLGPDELVLRSYVGVRNSPLVLPYIDANDEKARHSLYNLHFACTYKWNAKEEWEYQNFALNKIDLKTMTRKKRRPIEHLSPIYRADHYQEPNLGQHFAGADNTLFYWQIPSELQSSESSI